MNGSFNGFGKYIFPRICACQSLFQFFCIAIEESKKKYIFVSFGKTVFNKKKLSNYLATLNQREMFFYLFSFFWQHHKKKYFGYYKKNNCRALSWIYRITKLSHRSNWILVGSFPMWLQEIGQCYLNYATRIEIQTFLLL